METENTEKTKTRKPHLSISFSVADAKLLAFARLRANQHRGGLSGYLRALMEADRVVHASLEEARQKVMEKLTPEEREAIGLKA